MKLKLRIYESEIVEDAFPWQNGVRVVAKLADDEKGIVDIHGNKRLHDFQLSFVLGTTNPEAYAYGKEFEIELS